MQTRTTVRVPRYVVVSFTAAALILAGCMTGLVANAAPCAQSPIQNVVGNGCLTEEESRLYDLVTELRVKRGLPAIPVSPSLTLVAHYRVEDLIAQGRLTHGWRDCRYDADRSETFLCMWEAPQRLGTAYPGFGFENAFRHSSRATADNAFASWTRSAPHRAVILNQGAWAKQWKAIGLGIKGRFAVLWVGHEEDPESSCKERAADSSEKQSKQ